MLRSRVRDGRLGNVGLHSDLMTFDESNGVGDRSVGNPFVGLYGLVLFEPDQEVSEVEKTWARRVDVVGEILAL